MIYSDMQKDYLCLETEFWLKNIQTICLEKISKLSILKVNIGAFYAWIKWNWYSFKPDFLNIKTKFEQNVLKSFISKNCPDFPAKMSGN